MTYKYLANARVLIGLLQKQKPEISIPLLQATFNMDYHTAANLYEGLYEASCVDGMILDLKENF